MGGCSGCEADINGDGFVAGDDLAVVLIHWGAECVQEPLIASITPAGGPQWGGTEVVISGTNLASVQSVRFGAHPAVVTAASDTSLTVRTAAGEPGEVDVIVASSSGSSTLKGGFNYTRTDPPAWSTVLDETPDPSVVPDPLVRAAIEATGLPWRVFAGANGVQGEPVELVLVPSGLFQMGCSQPADGATCPPDALPAHTVELRPFYIGRTELTQAQYASWMNGANPSFFQGAKFPNSASRPVERVQRATIYDFLALTGTRLPTEAEWEFAYRAGAATAFHSMPGLPSGTNDFAQVGNIAWWGSCCGGNSAGQTRPVGGKAANALGLHDMAGNVWEWVNDWYSDTYYASSPSVNPPGPSSGSLRVLRGGSWGNGADGLRSSDRGGSTPGDAHDSSGFRVARAPL